GVPVKLGIGGAEAIIEYDLTAQEKSALDASAKAVKELCAQVENMLRKAS
ncbi:MAG: malate dehydrogenase, partial [Nitrospirales bacterium]